MSILPAVVLRTTEERIAEIRAHEIDSRRYGWFELADQMRQAADALEKHDPPLGCEIPFHGMAEGL